MRQYGRPPLATAGLLVLTVSVKWNRWYVYTRTRADGDVNVDTLATQCHYPLSSLSLSLSHSLGHPRRRSNYGGLANPRAQ